MPSAHNQKDIPLWAKWTGFIVAIAVGVFGVIWAINIYVAPSGTFFGYTLVHTPYIATTTPNLAEIFQQKDSFRTSLEKENFIQNYNDTVVYGIGSFDDVLQSPVGYTVEITIANNLVACQFGSDAEKSLLLLTKGQPITFMGTFNVGGTDLYDGVYPWYINDCSLLE